MRDIAKIKMWITVFALAAVLIWIFEMSAKPADESEALSGRIDYWICDVFIEDYQEFPVEEQQRILSTLDFRVRKTAHYIEYMVLGLLLYLTSEFIFEQRSVRVAVVISIGVLQALLDEYHQFFVSGRNSQLADVVLDTFGVCTGVLVIVFWSVLMKNKKEQKISGR